MEGLLGNATFILVLVLAVIFWIVYHQLFHVVYFGNGFNAMLREFVVCFALALVTVGIAAKFFLGIIAAIGGVLEGVGTLLVRLIKITAVILVVLLVIGCIGKILEKRGILKSEPKEPHKPVENKAVSGQGQDRPDD